MADLPNSKKAAILLKTNPSKAELLIAAALYQYFTNLNKQAEVVFTRNESTASVLKSLVPTIVLKDKLPPKKVVLSLKRDGANVDNVQWQQDQDTLNIYVSLSQGAFDLADLKFTSTGADYDLAILPNVSNLTDLGELASENQQFFKDVKIFTIGSEPNLGDNYQYSSSNRPNLTTLGEQVLAVMDSNQMKAEVAQMLWVAIMLETENITKQLKSSEIFSALKKLMEKGAKAEKSAELTNKLTELKSPETKSTDSQSTDLEPVTKVTTSPVPLKSK